MRDQRLFIRKKVLTAGLLSILAAFNPGPVWAAGAAAVDETGAEEIALADADITADQADRLRTKAEREDGENVYEVTFLVGNVEYEYLIREADGKILEWEMDGRDVGEAAAEKSLKVETKDKTADTLIGVERAKEIVLSDAGLNAEDVSFSKIKFEEDDRVLVYELEFYYERQEFEYTIDAYTEEIYKMERD
ncbi:MAG: PepSY domain-containing protein [Eubacteriales bacterium]|nr:PepSY domain-containing protein [Eubacteriales bacterium]